MASYVMRRAREMRMHMHRKAVGLVAGAVLLGFAAAVPAHAKGSRTTYFSGWHPGNESSRWSDNARRSSAKW